MEWLILVAGIGLAVLAYEAWAQFRLLRSGPSVAEGELPPVSILKPLRGTDSELAANLESFFHLDYPRYEVLFGAADGGDPAIQVARQVAARHPEIPSAVVVDGRCVGCNPKVNNLANLERRAAFEMTLISDSNVRVHPGFLTEMVATLARPGVGLVSSPVAAPAGSSVGARMEGLQLNTYVLGGVAAMHQLGGVCVMGKSMLLRRSTLAEIGGFAFLASFLAEDQVCGQEIARRGFSLALAPRPVVNITGHVTVAQFLSRHLRWAKIRRHISPLGYCGELLLNPVFLVLVALTIRPSFAGLALWLVALLGKSALDLAVERSLGVVRSPLEYPFLVLAKDLLLGVAWFVPWFDASVVWRGNRLRIGRRTRLEVRSGQGEEGAPHPAPETGFGTVSG